MFVLYVLSIHLSNPLVHNVPHIDTRVLWNALSDPEIENIFDIASATAWILGNAHLNVIDV